MEATIQFLTEIQNKYCLYNLPYRIEKLEITKIDGIPVSVTITHYKKLKNYKLSFSLNIENEPVWCETMYEKMYEPISEIYKMVDFANDLKADLTKIRYSQLENKFYTEEIEEEKKSLVTNFLCSDNPTIFIPKSIQECGVCFEKTKRKIDCCNNIVCLPCQMKIKIKKPFHHEEFECCEAKPCPFCRKVINTEFTFDEDEE